MGSFPIITLELGKAILVPSTMLIVTLGIGALLLWSALHNVGRWVVTITSIVLLALAVLPISSWIASPLETRFPSTGQSPKLVTGIILLGGAFRRDLTASWHTPELNDHADRLFAFMALARKYPTLRLVFSGGAGAFSKDLTTESDIARDLFESLGIDTDRIVFEDRSRNTCENATYTAQLVKPLEEQTWILVTSAMDMARAVGAFRKAGFRVLPYPVDYTTNRSITISLLPTVTGNLARLDHAAHEWLGLLAYRLMSCTDALFPAP